MTELLKHLDEADDASIPLLRNEFDDGSEGEVGLFTEEEILQSQMRKNIKYILKLLIPLVLVGLFLGASIITYKNVKNNLINQNIRYKLHSISVKNASESSSFDLSLNATVDASVPWSVDLKKFTVELLSENGNANNNKEVIVSATISDLRAISGLPISVYISDQSIQIKNAKALASMINKSISTKSAKIPLKIRTQLHPHWTPFTFKNVEMEKTIYLDFKRELGDLSKYFKLIDLKMEEAFNDDLIITASGMITNPLPFTIDKIPPVSFKVFSDKRVFIGHLKTLENLKLKRGSSNLVKLQGVLSSSSDPKTSDAIGQLITNHFMGKSSKIYLQGDEEASEKLNWLQSILTHINVPVDIPGQGQGKSQSSRQSLMFEDSIKKIDVKRILFALDPNKPNQISMDSDAEVHFNIPRFASMMRPTIESLALEGKVHDQKGNFIAPLSISDQQIDSGILSSQNSLNTSMRMDISVDSVNMPNVENFMAEMLYAQDANISVSGHSSVKTKMFLGRMTVPRIPFATEIKLPGLGQILSSQKPEIKSLNVEYITNEFMSLSAVISINNPTEITSLMGPMHLKCILEDNREYLGDVLLEDASIRPGKNELFGKMELKKSEAVEEFIGRYFSGKSQSIILQGVRGSESVHPILKNVIGAFVMRANLNPSTDKATFGQFVTAVTLKRKGFDLMPEVYMTVNNPFNFPIKILSVKYLKVYGYKTSESNEENNQEVLITEMETVQLKNPLVIPANSKNWTDEENPLPLEIDGNILRNLRALELIFSKKNPKDENGRKYLPIRIEGRIKTVVSSMELEFMFVKDRLPLYLDLMNGFNLE